MCDLDFQLAMTFLNIAWFLVCLACSAWCTVEAWAE